MADLPKKKVLIFTIADEKNKKYEQMMHNSLLKFHPDIDYYCLQGEELQAQLKIDPYFFYRATPILGEKFLKEYELVIKIDADSIICGDLSYIWKTTDYDLAGVLNYNRSDAQEFGLIGGWGILAIEYMNCGLVVMRNEKFVHDWKILCFTPQFERLQYKEQDLLNAMVYYGNWNVRILDHGDGPAQMQAWWGLISKGEWSRAILKDDKIYVPQGEGDTPFPPKEMELKVLHWAGGNSSPDKLQYRTRFNEDVIKRLNYLVGDSK